MGCHRSIGVGLGDVVRPGPAPGSIPDGLTAPATRHPWRTSVRISLKLFHRLNRRFIPVIPAN